MNASGALIQAVKKNLKSRGITYAELGKALRMSEAGVKRMFAKEAFTLQRLDEICAVMNIGLFDLVQMARGQQEQLASELTIEQEDALAADEQLLMVFYLVINGWSVEDMLAGRKLSQKTMRRLLSELDRLRLIELHPNDHIKKLTIPHIRWRADGPINKKYDRDAIAEFLFARFGDARAEFNFFFYQFSEASIRHIKRRIAALNAEILAFAETDAVLPTESKRDIGLLIAMRPWIFSVLAGKSGRKDEVSVE